ncbi:hypothetical protein WG954_19270 [Lacibacter sp. H375]|uniref:hypothetical protein n=1 Tax=Lacibacter sp. H375 TaxID=3133424 RepID=UPI0030BD4421
MNRIILFLVLICLVAVSSCRKPVEEITDPVTESSLSRVILLPNQSNFVKQALYINTDQLKLRAGIEADQLFFFFDAAPSVNNSTGDALLLSINASNLATGLVKTYSFNQAAPTSLHARYVYSSRQSSGDIWSSITDSRFGVVFEGELVITGYDSKRKLISGHYEIKAKNLINDPTVQSVGSPIDPINQCNLTLSGSFKYVKLP